MFTVFLTGVGALMTVNATNDNQRAIGAVILGVGLNHALQKVGD